MSLPYSPSRAVFDGNGAATRFPFTFRVWEPSEIAVFVTDPRGVTEPASACDVTLADSGHGGTVTCLHDGAPLGVGWRLTILRNMPFVQNVDLLSGTRFDPQVIEDQLDQATAERQQLKEAVDRAVKLPAASDMTPEEYGRELLDARDDAQQAAQQAAQSARQARHALAETVEAKASALREIREETDIQKDRLQAVADTTIITISREADRAHDQADRAQREADRAASTATLAVGCENLEAVWTLTEDIPAGGLLTLPAGLVYFPGRHMLRLSFEGITCYPGLHYEEVALTRPLDCPATAQQDVCPAGRLEVFPDLPSGQVRLLFAAAGGTVFHAWIVASNVARHVEDAEKGAEQARDEANAHADRACECADTSCRCADAAEKAGDTAVKAARDARESADRADDAAADAENAARKALAARCRLGIASVSEDVVLDKPLPHGFYILNPHIVLPATCSLPLYPVEGEEGILTGVEGFYLFAPHDPDCDPGRPDVPDTPDTPGTPDNPGDCPDW